MTGQVERRAQSPGRLVWARLLREALDLQQRWAASSTPSMDERGWLIRKELPAQLKSALPALSLPLSVILMFPVCEHDRRAWRIR